MRVMQKKPFSIPLQSKGHKHTRTARLARASSSSPEGRAHGLVVLTGEDEGLIPHTMKKTNEYAQQLDLTFYEKIPKAVLAAIAISFAHRIHGESSDTTHNLQDEWRALYTNGIVPQKPKLK